MEAKPPAPAAAANTATAWTGEFPTHMSVDGKTYAARLIPKGGAWVLSLIRLDHDAKVMWRTEGSIRHQTADQMGRLSVELGVDQTLIYLAPKGEIERFDYKTGRSLGVTQLPIGSEEEIGELFFAEYGFSIVNLFRSTSGARRFNLVSYDSKPPYKVDLTASAYDVAASPYGSAWLEMSENRVRIYPMSTKPALEAKWPIALDSRLFAYFSRWNDEVLIVGQDLTLGRLDGTLIAHLPNGGVGAIPIPGETGAWVKKGPNTWSYWANGQFKGTVTLPDGYMPHWEGLSGGYLLVPLLRSKGACTFSKDGQLFGCFDAVGNGEPNAAYWWGIRDGQMLNYGRGGF